MSVLAASAAGSSDARSKIVTSLYPRFKRCRAVEMPKHPLPTITIFDDLVRQGFAEVLGASLLVLVDAVPLKNFKIRVNIVVRWTDKRRVE